MKRLIPFLIIAVLLMIPACGGGDDDTPEITDTPDTPATTATSEPTATVEPTATTEPTATSEPPATTTPAPPETTAPATPSVDDNSVEAVLASVMDNLVVAFARVDGEWQAYTGPAATPIEILTKGEIYWWYASEQISLSTAILSTKWNFMASPFETGAIASTLEGFEDAIPFVASVDPVSQMNYLYISSSVTPLTEILPGQAYSTFVVEPGNFMPVMENDIIR